MFPNHWKLFADFARYEMMAGGPDPHMHYVGKMSEKETISEQVWRGGCYLSVYNVPTAEFIWQNWPYNKIHGHQIEFTAWITENWKKLLWRRERRAARTNIKLAVCLLSFVDWMQHAKIHASYEDMWDSLESVRYMGRYVNQKLLEYLRVHAGLPQLKAPDIRPNGGWSPRQAMALLLPHKRELLYGGNSRQIINEVNGLAQIVQKNLNDDWNVNISMFELAVLLCEYRESFDSKRQYPGRSNDSELGYYHRAKAIFGDAYETQMLKAREALLHPYFLGEKMGWEGPREDLGPLASERGYMWCDLLYDYNATTDFANPVRR